MKRRFRPGILIGLVLAVIAAGGWWLVARHTTGDDPAAGKEEAPVAQVKTSPLRQGSIERTLTAYGTAVAAPGGTRSLSFPFECRVVAVATNVGQPVKEGDILLQIEPSADARLALDTARAAQKAAEAALADVQERFRAHLATNADLATARSAARDARLKSDSLQSRAPGADGEVLSPSYGLVTGVTARPGVVVPAGGPLVELAVENHLEARLGIAPADAAQTRAGQPVHLSAVEGDAGTDPAALTGTLRIVGQSVDPATRLVDGFASIDPPSGHGAAILIGSYLRAEIVVEKKEALLAPRGSVQPDPEHPGQGTLFTVKSGKAAKHAVGLGIDDGQSVELTGDTAGLADGTAVVTEGAYELEDGMTVETALPAKAPPAAEKSGGEDHAP